jgi:hypothetical protein
VSLFAALPLLSSSRAARSSPVDDDGTLTHLAPRAIARCLPPRACVRHPFRPILPAICLCTLIRIALAMASHVGDLWDQDNEACKQYRLSIYSGIRTPMGYPTGILKIQTCLMTSQAYFAGFLFLARRSSWLTTSGQQLAFLTFNFARWEGTFSSAHHTQEELAAGTLRRLQTDQATCYAQNPLLPGTLLPEVHQAVPYFIEACKWFHKGYADSCELQGRQLRNELGQVSPYSLANLFQGAKCSAAEVLTAIFQISWPALRSRFHRQDAQSSSNNPYTQLTEAVLVPLMLYFNSLQQQLGLVTKSPEDELKSINYSRLQLPSVRQASAALDKLCQTLSIIYVCIENTVRRVISSSPDVEYTLAQQPKPGDSEPCVTCTLSPLVSPWSRTASLYHRRSSSAAFLDRCACSTSAGIRPTKPFSAFPLFTPLACIDITLWPVRCC